MKNYKLNPKFLLFSIFLSRTFSSEFQFDPKTKAYNSADFVNARLVTSQNLFDRTFLQGDMPYNIIYFCVRSRELANFANFTWDLYLTSYVAPMPFGEEAGFFEKSFIFFFKKFSTEKNLSKKKIFDVFFAILWKNGSFSIDWLNFLMTSFWKKINENLEIKPTPKPSKALNAEQVINLNAKDVDPSVLVWSYLYLWATRNNFFVTVIDSKGWSLLTWTGGNSDRTGTKQRATVFSADNAVYEACYLARTKGVQMLSIHIWTTFWLPQIKHCFDGLETSGLFVEEVIYWPIKTYGGCWKKKPRRV